jgi:hypothetical protein
MKEMTALSSGPYQEIDPAGLDALFEDDSAS